MAGPVDFLPKPVADEAINALLVSLGLPKATAIAAANVTAQYHRIYLLTVAAGDDAEDKKERELVLRVSGSHLPTMKTRNEVAILWWVKRNTDIPIPEVVAYSASVENPIGHEFTLLSRERGEPLSAVYATLSSEQTDAILDQLIDWLVQLHGGGHDQETWEHLGGLRPGAAVGDYDPARVVDETFWQSGDLGLWPAGETVASINIAGPYRSWVALVNDQVRHYARLIELHDSLAGVRDLVPRVRAFASAIATPAALAELNENTRPVLAHKDLRLANLLYDRSSQRVTAVLDWGFAGIVPSPLWDPRRAFLWDGGEDASSDDAKRTWVARFEERVRARGDARTTQLLLDNQAFASPRQEAMQNVADYLRAITEAGPRGQKAELVPKWRAAVEENLAKFDV